MDLVAEFTARVTPIKYITAIINIKSFEIEAKDQLKNKKKFEI